MADIETKKLDTEILGFIRKHEDKPATDPAFQSLVFRIFEYQFKRNENYRKFCEMEGKRPGRLRSWKEIPAMPAVGFKELVLSTFPIKKAVRVFKTSGTTREVHGAPTTKVWAGARGAHFFETLKLYEAALIPPFKKTLLPDAGRIPMFFLMESPGEAPNSSLSYMMGVVNKKFSSGKGRFYFRKEEPLFKDLARDLGKTKKKVMILATAFSLKGFLDYLKTKKISLKLPKGSRLMETGGFKGRLKAVSKKELYAECGKRLGIEKECCVSEYGMTELSSQLYAGESGIFKGPAWARTLVIDPRTGKEAKRGRIGLLRHFDLANRGSVLAVQTEDLGRKAGDGFEVVGRAPGGDLRGCSLTYEKFLNIS